ncbi:MAG: hypothetical protein ACLFWR_04270 [Acidimicrobiales bacterium]
MKDTTSRSGQAGSAGTAVRFAAAARALGEAARARSLTVPAFRSPPRLGGVDRTIRRRRDGGATIAIHLKDRPWPAVLADMVEGVVVANGLDGADAMRVRTALWAALDDDHEADAA